MGVSGIVLARKGCVEIIPVEYRVVCYKSYQLHGQNQDWKPYCGTADVWNGAGILLITLLLYGGRTEHLCSDLCASACDLSYL